MSTMNMPGFAAENSIYKTKVRYCMATVFDSQNAVQPALHAYCRVFYRNALRAAYDNDFVSLVVFDNAFQACEDA